MALTGVLVLIDIVWIFSVGGVWSTIIPENKAWNELHSIHTFVRALALFSILIKIGIMVLISLFKNQYRKMKNFFLFKWIINCETKNKSHYKLFIYISFY